MGKDSNIQWTDATWNFARGCTKVDGDCKYCFMYRDSYNGTRFDPNVVTRTKTTFDFPLRYKQTYSKVWHGRPLIFSPSYSDLWHPEIDSYRHEIWDIIRQCPHLIFQLLTKRPERIPEHLPPDWGEGWDNVWLGTSIGHMGDKAKQRVIDLSQVEAKVKFLSVEPMWQEVDLGEIKVKVRDMDFHVLSAFDWVIVGGESGNETGKYRYRPCEVAWIEKVVDDCTRNSIPVFVKQMGTHLSKELKMTDRHGGDINEFPLSLRKREFPRHVA